MADQKSLIIKLAHIYYHTGSWDKAIVEYQKIIAMDADDFNMHVTLGELYQKKGDLDKAYQEYELSANGFLREKNVKKAGNAFREMSNLIQKVTEPQDVDKAIGMYKSILDKMPDSTETMTNLRDLYQRHNQTDQAVSYTLLLGDLYNRLDYVDKAEAEYVKACDLAPSNTAAKQKLDNLRNELKKT